MNKQNLYRAIPSVQAILDHPNFSIYPINRNYLKKIIQSETENLRNEINNIDGLEESEVPNRLILFINKRLENLFLPRLKRVINGTGIVLHTNMGRAPSAAVAQKAILNSAENYNNIELDLKTGKRGSRHSILEDLLCLITGAEAGMMVNNCAAAVFLALNTFCNGKSVPISRGELVEIGGAFRMPDVMQTSGAIMKEIGTTNKTHLTDYQNAIFENTGALLKVHTSNYRVLGFTKEVALDELAILAKANKIPLIYDMGSGVIEDLQNWGIAQEPVVSDTLKLGVDVLMFSGDKILGGPQAGIIVGKKHYIDALKKNHLTRALRCDKLIYSSMEATLRLYLQPETLTKKLPVAKMLTETIVSLKKRAKVLQNNIKNKKLTIKIVDTYSQMGSGALPLEKIPSIALKISASHLDALKISQKMREFSPPIIGYINDDEFYINMRTVREDEVTWIENAFMAL